MTDRHRLRTAFKHLRKAGFIARMNWKCCMTCGYAAIEDLPEFKKQTETGAINVVFWHHQNEDAFNFDGNLSGTLYLAHDTRNLDVLIQTLRDNGLSVQWDGTPDRKIEVNHLGSWRDA